MHPLVSKLIPQFVLGRYGRVRRLWERRQNSKKTAEEVFTEIYEKSKWGGSQGEFCSGTGSANERTVAAYVAMISEQASAERVNDFETPTVFI